MATVQAIYRGPADRIRTSADSAWQPRNGEPFGIEEATLVRLAAMNHRFDLVDPQPNGRRRKPAAAAEEESEPDPSGQNSSQE